MVSSGETIFIPLSQLLRRAYLVLREQTKEIALGNYISYFFHAAFAIIDDERSVSNTDESYQHVKRVAVQFSLSLTSSSVLA